MEFVGSDPALNLKAPTDPATKLHYVKHVDQSNQNQLTILSEVMTVVVFGLAGIRVFHGWSRPAANSKPTTI